MAIGVVRLYRDPAALTGSRQMIVRPGDRAVIAAAGHADAAVVLLGAVNSVRLLVIRIKPVNLRRWLVIDG